MDRLNELLMEDDTLSECKSSNPKLIEFLTKPENLKQVIRYATRMPKEGATRDQQHRFPFIAADILISSIKIADGLMPLKPKEPEPEAPGPHDTETTMDTTQVSSSQKEPPNEEEKSLPNGTTTTATEEETDESKAV